MTARGTLGLNCVRIAELMTHPAIYTLPFTVILQASWHIQFSYKHLGILQGVTMSQKVHILSHDTLEKLHNISSFIKS